MKKRLLACLLALVLIVSVTGCSAPELGYYNTLKGMMSLKDYTFDGSYAFQIDKFEFNEMTPTSKKLSGLLKTMDPIPEFNPEDIINLLNSSTIVYDGMISKTENKVKFNLGLKAGDAETAYLIKYINEADKYYIYGDFFANYLMIVEPYETKTIDGTEYAELTEDQFVTMLAYMCLDFMPSFDEMPGDDDVDYETEDVPDEVMDPIKESIRVALKGSNAADNTNSVVNKAADELVNNFFSKLQLGFITKTGESKYKAELNGLSMAETFKNLAIYFVENMNSFKTSMKNIVNGLTLDEIDSFGIEITKEDMLEEIEAMEIPTAEEIIDFKDEIESLTDSLKAMFEVYDFSLVSTLEKTGTKSYASNGSLRIFNKVDEVPLEIDATITSTLNINKEAAGNIGAKTEISAGAGTQGKITISDPAADAVEYGVLCSLTNDFKNPVTIKGAKQADGSYKVDLSNLKDGATYYFKTYYKDNAGNIVFSSEVKSFKAQAAANTKTGDNLNVLIAVCALFALMTGAVLVLRKKRALSK